MHNQKFIVTAIDWDFYHLPDALEEFPNKGLLPYCRVSTPSQLGRPDLMNQKEQLQKLLARVEREVDCWDFIGQESGRVNEENAKLQAAISRARKRNLMVVAKDRTRFIRAISGEKAEPTTKERFELWRLFGDVPAVTCFGPKLTIPQINSEKQKLARQFSNCKPGPTGPDDSLIAEILNLKQEGCSIRNIAGQLRISQSKVQRVLDKDVPGREGEKLKSIDRPYDYWCALTGAGDYAVEMQCSLF